MNERTLTQTRTRSTAKSRTETRATYYRRRATAAAAAGVAAVTLLHIANSIRGDERFDHSYKEVAAELAAGKFAAGEATTLTIDKDQLAYDDALEFVGRSGTESNIDQVSTAISTQDGDTPQMGQQVILPTRDLLPEYRNK